MAKKTAKQPVTGNNERQPFKYDSFKVFTKVVALTHAVMNTWWLYPKLMGDRLWNKEWSKLYKAAQIQGLYRWDEVEFVTVSVGDVIYRINMHHGLAAGLATTPGKFVPKIRHTHYQVETMDQARELHTRLDKGKSRSKSCEVNTLVQDTSGYKSVDHTTVNKLHAGLNHLLGKGGVMGRNLTSEECALLLLKTGSSSSYFSEAQAVIGLLQMVKAKCAPNEKKLKLGLPALVAAMIATLRVSPDAALTFWEELIIGEPVLKFCDVRRELRDIISRVKVMANDGSSSTSKGDDIILMKSEDIYRMAIQYWNAWRCGLRPGDVPAGNGTGGRPTVHP